jgi:hypothetical protein
MMEALTTGSSSTSTRTSSPKRIKKSTSTSSMSSLFSHSDSISDDEKIGIDHSSLWYYDIIEKQESERMMRRQKLKNRITRIFSTRKSY